MIGARAIALSAMAALFGCAQRPPEVSSIGKPIRATDDATIVWWKVGPEERSAWVEADGEGFRVRAERAEAVVPARSSLWALRWVDAPPVALCASCACLLGQAEPTDDCRPRHETPRVHAMVRLGDGVLLSPGGNEASNAEPCEMTEFEHHVSLEASVGSVVVMTSHESLFACCAHGMDFDEVLWLDLATRAAIPGPIPQGAEARDAKAKALEQLRADPDGCAEGATSEAFELYATHLAYGAGGALGLEYEYTMASSYACGTGPGHYSTSTRVAAAVPTSLPPRPADYVARFVESLPKAATLGGIGAVDPSLFASFVKTPMPLP